MTHFAFRLVAAASILVGVSACALGPQPVEPSWTDAQLETKPPTSAPRTVSDQRVPPAARAQLAASTRAVVNARDQVITTGLQIQPPSIGLAEFVIEARRRADPPPQD